MFFKHTDLNEIPWNLNMEPEENRFFIFGIEIPCHIVLEHMQVHMALYIYI